MLKVWHASVPTLAVAFNLSLANFVSKMQDIDGFGQLAVKEVLSYLGVSGHEGFRTMAFELIPFGPGAKNDASVLILWMRTEASAAGDTCSHAPRSM